MSGRKFDKNILAFIANESSEGDVFPSSKLFEETNKKGMLNIIQSFVDNKNYNISPHLGLYFNFPYCDGKCMYCCVQSIGINDKKLIEKYISEIIEEINEVGKILKTQPEIEVEVLCFSGGTYTIIEDDLFEKFLQSIKENFKFKKNYTYEIEIHPGTLTENKVRIMKQQGVTNMTLGIQSMDEAVLKTVNRKQTIKDILRAAQNIKKYDFKIFGIDLIAGLPGEQKTNFLNNVKLILDYISPDIFNLYPFSPINNTPYIKSGQSYSAEQIIERDDMYSKAEKLILSYGYSRSSGFVKKGKDDTTIRGLQCKHDLSVISFGYPLEIQGNLYGVGTYDRGPKGEYREFLYSDKDLLIRRDLFKTTWLSTNNIDIDLYTKKYGVDILKDYESEFNYLFSENVVSYDEKENKLIFNLKHTWLKEIYRWVFLPEYLEKRIKEMRNYDEKIDYVLEFRNRLSDKF